MAERALRPRLLGAAGASWAGLPQPPTLCVVLAAIAVLLRLLITSHMLVASGVATELSAGTALLTLHVSTIVVGVAVAARVLATGRPAWALVHLLRRFGAVALFLAVLLVLSLCSVANAGLPGTGFDVEGDAAAGLLWLAVADARPRQLRVLGWLVLTVLVLNAIVGFAETVLHGPMTPMSWGARPTIETDPDVRGLVSSGDAPTGAVMTQVALFLLLGMGLPPAATALVGAPILLGMLGFGGRIVVFTTIVTLLVLGAGFMAGDAARRTPRSRGIAAVVAGAVVATAMGALVLTAAPVGGPLAGYLVHFEAGFSTGSVQWLVPGTMSFRELMLGLSDADLRQRVFQLGLQSQVDDVDTVWLRTFISLGAVGCVVYGLGLLAYLRQLWRATPLFGRVIVITTLFVASASAGAGVIGNLLFTMTGAAVAITGFATSRAAWEPPRASAFAAPLFAAIATASAATMCAASGSAAAGTGEAAGGTAANGRGPRALRATALSPS